MLPADAVADIVELASKSDGVFTAPQQWCTSNGHGWGYGLLQHDYIERFLVFTFAVSAHAQTRGTWTGALAPRQWVSSIRVIIRNRGSPLGSVYSPGLS